MIYLLILRHAKAGHGEGVTDHDRELVEKGRVEARHMGEYLGGKGLKAGRALVSTARRARETLDIVLGAMGSDAEVLEEGKMYNASGDTLLEIINKKGGEETSLMVCGHNPGMSELGSRLMGESIELHTSEVVVISFEVDRWADVVWGLGVKEEYVAKIK